MKRSFDLYHLMKLLYSKTFFSLKIIFAVFSYYFFYYVVKLISPELFYIFIYTFITKEVNIIFNTRFLESVPGEENKLFKMSVIPKLISVLCILCQLIMGSGKRHLAALQLNTESLHL